MQTCKLNLTMRYFANTFLKTFQVLVAIFYTKTVHIFRKLHSPICLLLHVLNAISLKTFNLIWKQLVFIQLAQCFVCYLQ